MSTFVNIAFVASVDVTRKMSFLFHIFHADITGTPIIRSKDNDGIIQLLVLLQCFYDLAHHVVYHDYEIAIRTDTGFALKLFRREYCGVRSSNRQI